MFIYFLRGLFRCLRFGGADCLLAIVFFLVRSMRDW